VSLPKSDLDLEFSFVLGGRDASNEKSSNVFSGSQILGSEVLVLMIQKF
jgi:hypothetical protein